MASQSSSRAATAVATATAPPAAIPLQFVAVSEARFDGVLVHSNTVVVTNGKSPIDLVEESRRTIEAHARRQGKAFNLIDRTAKVLVNNNTKDSLTFKFMRPYVTDWQQIKLYLRLENDGKRRLRLQIYEVWSAFEDGPRAVENSPPEGSQPPPSSQQRLAGQGASRRGGAGGPAVVEVVSDEEEEGRQSVRRRRRGSSPAQSSKGKRRKSAHQEVVETEYKQSASLWKDIVARWRCTNSFCQQRSAPACFPWQGDHLPIYSDVFIVWKKSIEAEQSTVEAPSFKVVEAMLEAAKRREVDNVRRKKSDNPATTVSNQPQMNQQFFLPWGQLPPYPYSSPLQQQQQFQPPPSIQPPLQPDDRSSPVPIEARSSKKIKRYIAWLKEKTTYRAELDQARVALEKDCWDLPMLKSKNRKKRERLEEIVPQFGIVELLRNNLQRFIDSGELLSDSNSSTSRASAASGDAGEAEEAEEEEEEAEMEENEEMEEEEDEEAYLKGLLDSSGNRE